MHKIGKTERFSIPIELELPEYIDQFLYDTFMNIFMIKKLSIGEMRGLAEYNFFQLSQHKEIKDLACNLEYLELSDRNSLGLNSPFYEDD